MQRHPDSAPLYAAIRAHDSIDEGLGHDDEMNDLLKSLFNRHEFSAESVANASVVAQLTWSFFDGIRRHYDADSKVAVPQRVGWTHAQDSLASCF